MKQKEQPACRGLSSRIFFEDAWYAEKIPYSEALEHARTYCNTCEMRRACLAMAMYYEKGAAVAHRFGIYAGFTPAQRHSLERRELEFEGADPTQLRQGLLPDGRCIPPIPNHGDNWTPRHTALADEVIAWLIENVLPDEEVPKVMSLARRLKVRVNDLRRVYEALLADQILENTGKVIVRRASASATTGWVPKHLRVPS